ncbi:hypothetical protein [Moraxella marmotae]|uniref:hypothetical protein n=1 Tax=Moraxella marmotae TaxID=3344520 RepID=UPI0035F43F94
MTIKKIGGVIHDKIRASIGGSSVNETKIANAYTLNIERINTPIKVIDGNMLSIENIRTYFSKNSLFAP